MNNDLYSYPLKFEFKIAALSPQFTVTDNSLNQIAYIKQKIFKLKEDVTVFEDNSMTNQLFKIKANQWLDWSASYAMTDSAGTSIGRIARKGGRSLFKAQYEIFDENDNHDLTINEESFVTRLLDGIMMQIPLLNMLSGLLFNPKYSITRPNGTQVALFSKNPSMIGRRFNVIKKSEFETGEEQRIILGLMMMVLLERRRG